MATREQLVEDYKAGKLTAGGLLEALDAIRPLVMASVKTTPYGIEVSLPGIARPKTMKANTWRALLSDEVRSMILKECAKQPATNGGK
jgi:hypothetical protein